MAAESESAHGGAEAAQAGLPQFDFSYFPSQLFWLALVFSALYLILGRALLPRIEAAIAQRGVKIEGDLGAARAANDDAQAARGAFEKTLAAARSEARAKADAVRKAAGEARAKAGAEADARLAQRLDAAETRLTAQRQEGLAAARAIAADTAAAVVERLTGAAVTPGAAEAAARAAQT